ncbi:flagellar assembly peptidoglycan hydrolase FlgJ [Nitrosospira sp. Is2]|uniref:flagellar assembly peptidoglycan hydrolase FlgJ n=1 Tax=Nitrosospira sp. Is2 TaxID=3080532 RepID=UPI0029541A2C|nr:flagellar assembly peptidoglycan hydrolase FlgJ [Nitrosospira sp. Is2]WON73591.1 flagellar assembly peptidoglycan hydrolase FlgJ [Nitrosospira sp. Is2]
MVAPADLSTRFALDVQAVNGLRAAADKTGQAGLEAAARQFEALFLGMMLKSMREATPKDSLLDSDQSRLYMSMLDQQLSQSMAARGVGLAEMMMRQLRDGLPPEAVQQVDSISARSAASAAEAAAVALPMLPPRQPNLRPDSAIVEPGEREQPAPPVSAQPPLAQPESQLPSQPLSQPPSRPLPQSQSSFRTQPSHVAEFSDRLMAYAQEASQATGIPARFVLGQAALESGWGKRELRAPDGAPSHNLFGIKAGGNWSGRVVEAVTTEYVNGVARKTVEQFRAYDSYADAFRDYAKLLRSSPRYADLLAQAARGIDVAGFSQGLQKAGYATDPDYADKLSRTIKTTPQS